MCKYCIATWTIPKCQSSCYLRARLINFLKCFMVQMKCVFQVTSAHAKSSVACMLITYQNRSRKAQQCWTDMLLFWQPPIENNISYVQCVILSRPKQIKCFHRVKNYTPNNSIFILKVKGRQCTLQYWVADLNVNLEWACYTLLNFKYSY